MVEETSYRDIHAPNEEAPSAEQLKALAFNFTTDYLLQRFDTVTLAGIYRGFKGNYLTSSILKHLNGKEMIKTYLGADALKEGKSHSFTQIYEMDKQTLFHTARTEGSKLYRVVKSVSGMQDSMALALTEKSINPFSQRIEDRVEEIQANDFQRFKGQILRCTFAREKPLRKEQYAEGIIQSLLDSHPPIITKLADLDKPQNLDYLLHRAN